jgi:hypothetical protein
MTYLTQVDKYFLKVSKHLYYLYFLQKLKDFNFTSYK